MKGEMLNKIMAYLVIAVASTVVVFHVLRSASNQRAKNVWLAPDGSKYSIVYCDCNTPSLEAVNCGPLRYLKPDEGASAAAGLRLERVNNRDVAYIVPSIKFDCEAPEAQWRFVKVQ